MITNYNNELRFYNYLYLDPEKPGSFPIKGLDIILRFEPFYAGKGTDNRINDHKYGHSGKFMKIKMNSLKIKGLKAITVKINDNLSEEEAYENEEYLVKSIGRRDLRLGPLCNLNNGGGKGFGKIVSLETKLKMSIAKKGKVCSAEHCKNIGISKKGHSYNKGVPKTEEHKKKLSLAKIGIIPWCTGKKLSKEHKDKIKESKKKNLKKVLQYDMNLKFIKEWSSREEIREVTGIVRVERVCSGARKSAGGFVWKYKNTKK